MRNANGNLVARVDKVFLSKQNGERHKVCGGGAGNISEAIWLPLALVTKAANVTKLAVKAKVNIFLHVAKNLPREDRVRVSAKGELDFTLKIARTHQYFLNDNRENVWPKCFEMISYIARDQADSSLDSPGRHLPFSRPAVSESLCFGQHPTMSVLKAPYGTWSSPITAEAITKGVSFLSFHWFQFTHEHCYRTTGE